MRDVIRLTGQSKSILATYGETPNKAIYSMSDAIRTLQNEVSHQKDVTEALQTAFQSVTISNNVTHPLQKPLQSVTPFQKGSERKDEMFRLKYKEKMYDVKSDKNGDYIIDSNQMKRIVRDGKVVE